MESILTSVKQFLDIEPDYDHFDPVIINHINTYFFELYQIGVGPPIPYAISDATATWDQFTDMTMYQAVKTWMQIMVKLVFDPPTNSFTLDSYHREASELLWRLNVQTEGGFTDD